MASPENGLLVGFGELEDRYPPGSKCTVPTSLPYSIKKCGLDVLPLSVSWAECVSVGLNTTGMMGGLLWAQVVTDICLKCPLVLSWVAHNRRHLLPCDEAALRGGPCDKTLALCKVTWVKPRCRHMTYSSLLGVSDPGTQQGHRHIPDLNAMRLIGNCCFKLWVWNYLLLRNMKVK